MENNYDAMRKGIVESVGDSHTLRSYSGLSRPPPRQLPVVKSAKALNCKVINVTSRFPVDYAEGMLV